MDEAVYLGVDLGGTQLRMAAVDRSGGLTTEVISVPTGSHFGPDDFTTQIRNLRAELQARIGNTDIAALGIGTPGVIVENAITQSDNLPRLNGSNLRTLVGERAAFAVKVENDARCFALAEARFGAGRGASTLCGVTLGTGVGCGVIINRQVHRGANAAAGEVYRIPLRGRHLEYFLSGPGLVRTYHAAGGQTPEGAGVLDGAGIAELARAGNGAARTAWRTFVEDLHFVCECIVSLVDPEVIVIGGSITQARDLFGDELARRLAGHATRIAYAELGTAAGVIGAAALNIAA
jgi:predicted NBD/HSP70 family sugar kinase